MKPSFLADQCLPHSVIRQLGGAVYDVILVRDVLPIRAPDPDVLAKAQNLDRILLSLNGDFADIVRYPPIRFGGIVTMQFHNRPEIIPSVTRNLLSFMAKNPDREFYRGKLLLVETHRIRIRH